MRAAHLAGYLLADILRWQLPSCKDRRTNVPCKTGFTVSTLTNYGVTWNVYFQSLLQYLDHLQEGLSLPGAFITIHTVLLIILFCFERILNTLMEVSQIWQNFTFSLTLPTKEGRANKNPQHLLLSLASQFLFATTSHHSSAPAYIVVSIPVPARMPGSQPSRMTLFFFTCLWSRVTTKKVSCFADQQSRHSST